MRTSTRGMTVLAKAAIIACLSLGADGRDTYALEAHTSDATTLPGGNKPVIPPTRDQFQAEQTIRGLFHAEYADHTPAARVSLAAKLVRQGAATEGDPALRFVCFRDARDLAGSAGDLATAMSAIDSLDNEFAVDAQTMRVTAFLQVAPATAPETCPAAVDVGMSIRDRSLALEDYAGANPLQGALELLANTSKQLPLVAKVRARRPEIASLQRDAAAYRLSSETLRKDPADESANTVVGKHLALVKGDFTHALAYLAKGNDPSLKELALREIEKPTAPVEVVRIGDAWWEIGTKMGGVAEDAAHKHAVLLYGRVRPLLSGSDLSHVDSRIPADASSLSPATGAARPVPPGAAVSGVAKAGAVQSFDLPQGPPSYVQFTADGRYVVSSGKSGTMVWDAQSGKLVQTWKGEFGQPLPDSRHVVMGCDGKWSVMSIQTGKEENHLPDFNGHGILCRDGSSLMIEKGDKQAQIEVYDLRGGGTPKVFDHHVPFSEQLAFSPDGKVFATSTVWDGNAIRGWDAASGSELWRGEARGGSDKILFSRDGRLLLRLRHSPGLSVHDAQTGRILVECDCPKWAHDAALASNGRFVVAAFAEPSEGIRLFDLSSVEKGNVKPANWSAETSGFGVNFVALSADDRRLLAGCKDKQLRLFDVATGSLLAHFDHDSEPTAAAFSLDGLSAVSGDEKAVHVWRLPESGKKK